MQFNLRSVLAGIAFCAVELSLISAGRTDAQLLPLVTAIATVLLLMVVLTFCARLASRGPDAVAVAFMSLSVVLLLTSVVGTALFASW
ncbi:MAG TPA: hypothetical protein VGN12_21420 [Pirellulales bacterium]|jgi:hypothetical protein